MLGNDEVFANRYRIIRKIATGGMGVVYEARHIETARPVALKVMLPQFAENEALRERFRREARAAAEVSSTHVVEVLDAGVDERTAAPFMVMELLRGEDFGQRIKRLGPLGSDEVCRVIDEAAKGLDALHKASIVHRDLKPSNLFLASRDGEAPRVKVLDLGIAKRVAESAASTAAVGTPFYMAPEQLENGNINAQTDVFALGMVVYSLLVGTEYWHDEASTATSTISLALTMLGGPTEAASTRARRAGVTLPDAFDAWFGKATARAQKERFASAIEAAEALFLVFGGESLPPPRVSAALAFAETLATPAPEQHNAITANAGLTKTNLDVIPQKTAGTRRSWPRVAGILGALALGALAVGSFVRTQKHEAEVPAPAPAPPPTLHSLACPKAPQTSATLAPSLAFALGKSACARLAIEIGLPFGKDDGTPLVVHAEREGESTRVTLEIAGSRVEGVGNTPIVATNNAISALVPLLHVAPMKPERVKAWGETDGAAARRVERVVRRHGYHIERYDLETARALVTTNPESPIAQLMVAYQLKRSDAADPKELQAAKDRVLTLASSLPEPQKILISGLFYAYVMGTQDGGFDRGFALLQKAYAALGDDPDFPVLFTLCGFFLTDQTPVIIDRFANHDRTVALPLIATLFHGSLLEDDTARRDRLLALVRDELPELRANLIKDLLEGELVDEAHAALEDRRALGAPEKTSASQKELDAIMALVNLDGDAAIAAADTLFAEPNVELSSGGAKLRLEAMLMKGRVERAEAAFILEAGRLKAGNLLDHAAAIEARRQTILDLLGQTKPNRTQAKKLALEFRANKLPRARRDGAFRAALALSALGEDDEAEKAYRLAISPAWSWERGFEVIVSRVRLAALLRKTGRNDEAKALDAEVDRAWVDADPGLRDTVLRLSY